MFYFILITITLLSLRYCWHKLNKCLEHTTKVEDDTDNYYSLNPIEHETN